MIDIIKKIKFSRLSISEKIIYGMLEDAKFIIEKTLNDTKFLLSKNNDVLVEIDDLNDHMLIRFNYDILWVPYLYNIKIDLNEFIYPYLIDKMKLDLNNKKIQPIGGVSVKYLPYDKY